MFRYLAAVLALLFSASAFSQSKYLADADTMLNKNSGITAIQVNKKNIQTLTNLGMLWGFIKYYHPNVRKGDYNMDAELFRFLPKVLACTNSKAANQLMEEWLSHFGEVKKRYNYTPYDSAKYIKLMPGYGYLFEPGNFSRQFTEKLEFIKNNPDSKQVPYYIGVAHSAILKHEQAYKDSFPDAGTRLLALYRYWNVINYFYPYRHLIRDDWNKVLGEFIPVFCNATDTASYVIACRDLIARIEDSHSSPSDGLVHGYYNDFYTFPIRTIMRDGKLVVVDVYDTLGIKDKIKPGDIIDEVDGLTIGEHIKRNENKLCVSNYSDRMHLLASWSGPVFCARDTAIHLKISRGNKEMEYHFPRTPFLKSFAITGRYQGAAYKIIANDIGYIYAGKLGPNDFDTLSKKLNDTKGLIIDLRCYPGTFMPFVYGKWLKCEKSKFVRFSRANLDMPGQFIMDQTTTNGGGENCYKGKVVILVNHSTVSQSEYTAMALSSAPGAIVIGDTTAGADGDVSDIMLPGDIHTLMSGLGILYPDGGETQKTGVKIDKFVRPSIEDILAGKDAVLEAAVALIHQ